MTTKGQASASMFSNYQWHTFIKCRLTPVLVVIAWVWEFLWGTGMHLCGDGYGCKRNL